MTDLLERHPRPWTRSWDRLIDANGTTVIGMLNDGNHDLHDFIVTAVNAYSPSTTPADAELLAMCERLTERWYNPRLDRPDIDETELVLDAKAVARALRARLQAEAAAPQADHRGVSGDVREGP